VVKRHPGSLVRVCRRAHSDERGVTLLETIIAVTVVFGSLLMLAYTATIGFTYTGLARDRQSATGVANQIMEQIRGLATDRFVKGLSSSDLAGDPNIVLCGSDYRFKTCSGDFIVHTPGLTTSVPLVPHRGTVSAGFPTAFDWAVYVTNNDPATEPYLVTVIVSWTGGTSAGAHYVQSQSVVFDPKGCLDKTVHPFPGPCQPIFITDATRDSGRITISGTVSGLGTFTSAALVLAGARSEIKSEQVAVVQGTASQPGAQLVLSSGTQAVGLSGASTSADGDPTTASDTYSSSTLSPATGASSTVTSAGNSLTVSNGAGGDVGSAVSATSADALTAPCPLSTSENDHHPCGAASVQQASTLSATMVLDGLTPQLNNVTLARVLPESVQSTTRTDFQEQAGADGLERPTVSRSVGTVNLLNLPTPKMTPPVGFTYLVLLTNYSDTATAEVGTNTSAPSASINAGGLLSYWVTSNCNTGAGAYTTVAVPSTPMTYQPHFCKTQRFAGKDVTVTMDGTITSGGVSTRQTVSGSTRTSAEAIVKSPLKASLTYTIDIQGTGTPVVSLTLDVDLGQMVATGTYTAAPTG
jgi:hypothetical protein